MERPFTIAKQTLEIAIRPLAGLAEFQQSVELQGAVWGYEDCDIVPSRLFLLAQKIGGQAIGAFAQAEVPGGQPRLAGFAFALPGYRDGMAYLHSHMLAVLPEYRDAGIGRRLKLAQRDDAVRRGIERMEWTFDPLEIKNAWFNVARLGAIVRRYQPDLYGPSSSPLQGGLPTDRLFAEWWLRSPWVEANLRGASCEVPVAKRIFVPKAVAEWKRAPEFRERAAELQRANRLAFLSAFGRGLAVIGYERDEEGNGTFLLGAVPEDVSRKS